MGPLRWSSGFCGLADLQVDISVWEKNIISIFDPDDRFNMFHGIRTQKNNNLISNVVRTSNLT
jgi:hypothetical protein